jgi:hypothetical protein
MEQTASVEILVAREQCSSTGCAKLPLGMEGSFVPDKSGTYSRPQQLVAMAAQLDYVAVLEMADEVPAKVAAELVANGCTVDGRTVSWDGAGPIEKDLRVALFQAALITPPVAYGITPNLEPLGFDGVQTLAVILDATSSTVDKMVGFRNSWAPEATAAIAGCKELDGLAVPCPEDITFAGHVRHMHDVLAVHRVAQAYLGRAAFSRPGALGKLNRESTDKSLKIHFFQGSSSWTRLLKNNTIPGDRAVVDCLVARAHHIAEGTL